MTEWIVSLAPPIQQAETKKSSIRFTFSDGEILRLEANGDIFVKGRLVGTDQEIVDGLREVVRAFMYPTNPAVGQ
jgi:hypothetical protein